MKIRLILLTATLCACARLAFGQAGCNEGSGETISVTNFKGGETIASDLALVEGRVGASAAMVRATVNGVGRDWPAARGVFKAVIPMAKEGPNQVLLGAAGHRNACLTLHFSPNHVGPMLQPVFVTGSDAGDGPGLIPVPKGDPSDFASVKKRLGFLAQLGQAAYAELLHQAGQPRRTFTLKHDAQGGVDVMLYRHTLTTAQMREKGEAVRGEIESAFKAKHFGDGSHYFMHMGPFHQGAVSDNRYIGWHSGQVMYSFAEDLDGLARAFSDTRSPTSLGMKNDGGDAFWSVYSTGLGCFLHEMGHSYGLPHSGTGRDIMRYGTFAAHSIFMVRDPAKFIGLARLVEWGDTSRTLLLRNSAILGPPSVQSAIGVTPALPGLEYGYYEGAFNSLPVFSSLSPTRKGDTTGLGIGVAGRQEQFALAFTGFLKAPANGEYAFFLRSDDGSRVLIGDAVVAANDGIHDDKDVRGGAIALAQGMHRFRVEYFQNSGGLGLHLDWAGPGFARGPVPDSVLFRTIDTSIPGAMRRSSSREPVLFTRSGDGLRVHLNRAQDVSLQLYTPTGVRKGVLHRGLLAPGAHTFPLPAGTPKGSLLLLKSSQGARTLPLP